MPYADVPAPLGLPKGFVLIAGHRYRLTVAATPSSPQNLRTSFLWAGFDNADLTIYTSIQQLPGDWPAQPAAFPAPPVWAEGTYRGQTGTVDSWPLPNYAGDVEILGAWDRVATGPQPSPSPAPSPSPSPAPAPTPGPTPQPPAPSPYPEPVPARQGPPFVLLALAAALGVGILWRERRM